MDGRYIRRLIIAIVPNNNFPLIRAIRVKRRLEIIINNSAPAPLNCINILFFSIYLGVLQNPSCGLTRHLSQAIDMGKVMERKERNAHIPFDTEIPSIFGRANIKPEILLNKNAT